MPRIHPTAIVEDGVSVGSGTSVWDNAHLRAGATIGSNCIVGDKAYVGPDVVVGDLVKLNTAVYLCTGVTLERGVMVAAHAVFTNDRFPRATDPDLEALRPSEADEDTLATTVREGATIGASAIIGPGIEIGRWAMVGMGSVVTRDVPPYAIVVGNPARPVGFACKCGRALGTGAPAETSTTATCDACGRAYTCSGLDVAEVGESQP